MTAVVDSFSAEWLKLRRRPAVLVLAAILVALVLLNYGVLFLVILTAPSGTAFGPGITADRLRETLYPASVVQMALGNFAGGGLAGSLALILGALAYGSEYGWGTLKTVLTQRPGRLATFIGKTLAVALVLAAYVVLAFAFAAAASAAIAVQAGAPLAWPAAEDVGKALLAAWLVAGLWGGLGMALAVLFRQAALAIGLGLVYAILVESVIFGLGGQVQWLQSIQQVFPGSRATALVRSFGQSLEVAPSAPIDAVQAALVVAAYVVLFLAVSAVLLRVRDVT